ncbi:MAG: hypothetical protein DCC68_03495 [Planctomycetota bacterium]|nr:MAG: hypothetical protein DCC68_03495 [Planctomycetota bacterium]
MLRALLNILGSLKLAVGLLLLLGGILATATFLEANRGREFAAWHVYGSTWFIALLAALAVNILAAALSRWPWKRRHAGFVVTHAGLLVLLAGAVQTFMHGSEGQVVLREGDGTSEMLVRDESLIQVVRKTPSGTLSTELAFAPGPGDWQDGHELDFGVEKGLGVKVLKFYRHALEHMEWVADDRLFDGPALQLALADAHGKVVAEEWLAGNIYGGEAVIGPTMYTMLPIVEKSMEQDFLDPPPIASVAAGVLSLHCDGEMQRIDVAEHVGKKVAVGKAGVQVEIVEYLPNARPNASGRFESRGAVARNPMLELLVYEPGNSKPTRQVAFAKRPLLNLDGVHGKPCRAKFWYHHADAKPESGAAFMQTTDGRLFCRAAAGGAYSEPQLVREGGDLQLVGGFKLSVRRYLPRARHDARFKPVASSPRQKNPPEAAALVEVSTGETTRRIWLRRGDPLHGTCTIPSDQGPLTLSFDYARRPLGFTLRLVDFTRTQNPGRVGNATFSSAVEVMDPQADDKQSFDISMNRPLSYGKFTFYQSSFEDAGHAKSASVLAVAYDPGRFLKYLGSAMICGGIFAMFYMRAYFFANVPRAFGRRDAQSLTPPVPPPVVHSAAESQQRAA